MKAGLLSLMMALVFITGWVRSLNTFDEVTLPARKHVENGLISFNADTFMSVRQSVIWKRIHQQGEASDNVLIELMELSVPSAGWRSSSKLPNFDRPIFNLDCYIMKRRWRSYGFGICEASPVGGNWAMLVFVPYWSIVIPLTFVSAFLLLSKPRPASTDISEVDTTNE